MPNAMFIDHVRAPLEDGVPAVRAKDVLDVDTLSNGPVPLVLREDFREFDLIDSDYHRGVAMHTRPPRTTEIDVYTPVIAVPKCLGSVEPSFVRH